MSKIIVKIKNNSKSQLSEGVGDFFKNIFGFLSNQEKTGVQYMANSQKVFDALKAKNDQLAKQSFQNVSSQMDKRYIEMNKKEINSFIEESSKALSAANEAIQSEDTTALNASKQKLQEVLQKIDDRNDEFLRSDSGFSEQLTSVINQYGAIIDQITTIVENIDKIKKTRDMAILDKRPSYKKYFTLKPAADSDKKIQDLLIDFSSKFIVYEKPKKVANSISTLKEEQQVLPGFDNPEKMKEDFQKFVKPFNAALKKNRIIIHRNAVKSLYDVQQQTVNIIKYIPEIDGIYEFTIFIKQYQIIIKKSVGKDVNYTNSFKELKLLADEAEKFYVKYTIDPTVTTPAPTA